MFIYDVLMMIDINDIKRKRKWCPVLWYIININVYDVSGLLLFGKWIWWKEKEKKISNIEKKSYMILLNKCYEKVFSVMKIFWKRKKKTKDNGMAWIMIMMMMNNNK